MHHHSVPMIVSRFTTFSKNCGFCQTTNFFFARSATSPVRFLHGAHVILVLWKISQFRSFGKWALTRWLPGTTRPCGTKDGSREELACESLGSVTLPFTRFSLNSCSHCSISESNGSSLSFSWSSFLVGCVFLVRLRNGSLRSVSSAISHSTCAGTCLEPVTFLRWWCWRCCSRRA